MISLDRLFLDANVLFSASYRINSPLRQLWLLAGKDVVTLVTSTYAVAEVQRNIQAEGQLERLEKLLSQVEVRALPPSTMMPAELPELPEKDRPILLAAIAAKATHLITSDFTHFGPLYGKTVEGVLILPPTSYLQR